MARDNDRKRSFTNEKIIGTGHVGSDPKRISGEGKMNVVVLSVAANSTKVDSDGTEVEHTEWRNLKLFGREADRALHSIKKGDLVKYEGRLYPNPEDNDWSDEVEIEYNGLTLIPSDGNEKSSRHGDDEKPSRRKPASRSKSRRKAEPEPEEDDYEDEFEDDEDDIEEEAPAPRKRTRGRARKSAKPAETDDDIDDYDSDTLI